MKQKEEIAFQNGYAAGCKAAQEVFMKHTDEMKEKIRQEAVEEFRKGLLEYMKDEKSGEVGDMRLGYENAMYDVGEYKLSIQ